MKAPSRKEIRQFGWILLAAAVLGGGGLWRAHKPFPAEVLAWAAGAAGFLALLCPPAAAPLYRVWMAVGRAMGFVTSRVALVLIYYAVLTPVGWILRLQGRDPLNLKKAPGRDGGYWRDLPPVEDKSYYDHLF